MEKKSLTAGYTIHAVFDINPLTRISITNRLKDVY